MKILLIRSPRYNWPFINENDNYLLPQSLPCLAAVLRENDIVVKPIDCMPLKIGWKSLARIIEKESPDAVSVGDSESLYSNEALNVLKMTKEIDPEIATVAGGAHFSNLIEDTLKNNFVDFIVRGEGEYTLLELVKEIGKHQPAFEKINGISFKKDSRIITTKPRPLIENLDELPLPAYDLMPMKDYGKSKYLFHPGGATIHHSRGCVGNCSFCACWVQMSEQKLEDGKIVCRPRWRTKSVKRTIEEIELLYYKYKKKGLVFTDDTWNVNQEWNKEFALSILERGLNINWFAFMRADFIRRDEKAGIFGNLVKAGLSHICIGVERAFDKDLKGFNKKNYSHDLTKECFHMLRNRYPQIFRQATFIIGLKNETRESMMQQLEYAKEIDADFPAFHPMTPVPGTELWNIARKNKWIEVDDFRSYDWLTPVISSETLSREEIEEIAIEMNNKYFTPDRLIKGLLNPYKYKRKMYIWFFLVALRIGSEIFRDYFSLRKKNQKPAFTKLIKPEWYDS